MEIQVDRNESTHSAQNQTRFTTAHVVSSISQKMPHLFQYP